MRNWAKRLSLALCGLALGGACIKSEPRPKLPMQATRVAVSEGRLKSGFRLVVETVDASDVAGAVWVVSAGAAQDPIGKEGLAHAVEHLVFRSRHDGKPELQSRLNRLVATWNGATTHDYAYYYAFVPKTEFGELVDQLVDALTKPVSEIGMDMLEHERRVLEAERGFRAEHASGQVDNWVYEAVFSPSHRYGRPVGGTAAALQTLTLADIEDFTARHYQPQNMTLYVLAPLELDAAKVVLDKLPGAFTGADLKQQMARGSLEGSSTGALREPGVLHRRKAAVPAPELWLAWPLSAGTLDERARAELLTELVRVGAIPQFGSHTAVAGARCGLDSLLFSALLTCRIFLNEVSSVETVAERVLGDIRDVMQVRPFGSDWIWWLRRRLALSWGLDEERVERRGVGFALAAHLYGDALDLRKVAAELQELDFRAITRDGYGLAQPEKTYMLLVEPLPSAATGPSVRMGFATPLADSASSAEPDIEPELAVQRLPRRAFDEVTTFRLASGLTVVLKPEAGTPYLTALLGFRGGAAWAGTAAVARAAQAGEVWKLTPDPVTWAIDLKRTRGRDSQAEIARTTSGDLNKVLEVLESASYPVIEWPSHRFRRAMPAQRRWDDAPEQVAERRLLSGLFGDHPYAAYAAVHDVEQVSFQATRRYTDAIRQPENAALIVVGDVDPSALRAASERHLAGFRGFGTGRVVAPPRPALEQTAARARSVSVVHRPRSTQADLEYGCLIPLATAADLAVLELAREVLDDELELRLRHRTGTAYFAGARTIPTLSDVSELRLATSVSSAHLPEALRALEEIFADGEAALEHLDDVRSRLIRSFAFRATTTHEKALELYDAWLRGLPWRSLDDRPRQIALAPVDQLRAALRICRANSALSVVGDEPAIRVALQAAGQ